MIPTTPWMNLYARLKSLRKMKKPETKGHMLSYKYGSIDMKRSEKANPERQKSVSDVQGWGGRE